MPVYLQVVIIALLILMNGVFALIEIALVSSRRSHLEYLKRRKNASAVIALELIDSPNQFLAAIQVGITLMGTLSGTLGGATLAVALNDWLNHVEFLKPFAQEISLIIVVTSITYFSLVFGELIPKRLGLSQAESIALKVARPMRLLSKIFLPVIKILSLSTDIGLKVLGINPQEELPISEEEIKLLLRQATQKGVFQHREQQMVESVFRLGDRHAEAIMTPRTEVQWLDLEDPIELNLEKIRQNKHSLFPVARHSLDSVVGILRSRDLLLCDCELENINLESLLLTPLFIPEHTSALSMLEKIKHNECHLALIIDEYGGVIGLVTLFDLLESIVGDIPGKKVETDVQIYQRPDGSWLVDGMLGIDEFLDFFDLEAKSGNTQNDYQTLAGFILSQLGEIPVTGQTFTWSGYKFEIVDMDRHRVDKVLISKIKTLQE